MDTQPTANFNKYDSQEKAQHQQQQKPTWTTNPCCQQELALAQKNLEESKSEALKAIEVANSRKEREQQAAEMARQARAARDKLMQGEKACTRAWRRRSPAWLPATRSRPEGCWLLQDGVLSVLVLVESATPSLMIVHGV